jgi:hypothetical protein
VQRSFGQHQAKYFAHFLTREGFEDGEALTQSLGSVLNFVYPVRSMRFGTLKRRSAR